jgi:iron complex outermembrane receptor protein
MWRTTACILLTISSATAHAQSVATYDVDAQPLADALRIVASQSNLNILYDPRLVKGRTTIAFKVQATPAEALARLLDGTGLKLQYVNEKTVTLVQLPTPVVAESGEGASPNSGVGEGRVGRTKAAEK